MQQDRERSGYVLSTDKARLDVDAIAAFLSERSYWAQGRPRAMIERSIEQSLCIGIYQRETGAQAAFARVVTDYATFAWVCDVFVLEDHRGHGLGKWLIETLTTMPELATLPRMWLATRDAHGLYAQYGFAPHPAPDRIMVRFVPPT